MRVNTSIRLRNGSQKKIDSIQIASGANSLIEMQARVYGYHPIMVAQKGNVESMHWYHHDHRTKHVTLISNLVAGTSKTRGVQIRVFFAKHIILSEPTFRSIYQS